MLRYIKSFFVSTEKFESSEDPVAKTLTEEQSRMPGNYKLQQYSRNSTQECTAPFKGVLPLHESFFKDYRNFLEGTRKERSNDEGPAMFRELTKYGNGIASDTVRMIGQDTRNYQRDNCSAPK